MQADTIQFSAVISVILKIWQMEYCDTSLLNQSAISTDTVYKKGEVWVMMLHRLTSFDPVP